MSWLFDAFLIGLVVVCIVWILALRKRIQEVSTSANERRPILAVGKRGGWVDPIPDLRVAVGELVRENHELSRTEKTYLEQIQATLGSIREAVLILDANNYIVLGNESARELLQSVESPVGKRLESMIHGAELHAYIRRIKEGGAEGSAVIEVSVLRSKLWLEVTGTRLPEEGRGGGSLSLFVLHDITRQKHLERVRTEFVANVSHELRTPVTVIKGFVDALIDDSDGLSPEEQKRFLLKIQNNVGRLHGMLEDLLMLSRLEANPDAVQRSKQSLNKIVSEVVDNFRMRLDKGEQQLRVSLTNGPDVVLLDSLRITQVLENLLENALRHARGFRNLEVSTEVSGSGVVCAVRDDGAGIPVKDLPHIFERFYRVDKGRSRESGGTGLGLSIVKHIIQLHGGEMEAESVPGSGTTIRFRIPYPEALAERAVLSYVSERAGRGSGGTGQG